MQVCVWVASLFALANIKARGTTWSGPTLHPPTGGTPSGHADDTAYPAKTRMFRVTPGPQTCTPAAGYSPEPAGPSLPAALQASHDWATGGIAVMPMPPAA